MNPIVLVWLCLYTDHADTNFNLWSMMEQFLNESNDFLQPILLNNLYLLAKNSNICNQVALSKFLFKPVFGLVSFFYIPSRIFQYSLASVPLAKQSFWQSTPLQYWLIRECLNFFSVKYKRNNQKDAVNNFFIRV